MKMIIKKNEINKVAQILAKNNFINVKDVNKLEKYLFITISNYCLLSIKKNFNAILNFNKDEKKYANIFQILVNDYNFLFDENVKIKEEDIEVLIIE